MLRNGNLNINYRACARLCDAIFRITEAVKIQNSFKVQQWNANGKVILIKSLLNKRVPKIMKKLNNILTDEIKLYPINISQTHYLSYFI